MSFTYKNQRTWQNAGSGISAFALLAPVSSFAVGGIKSPVAPFTSPGDSIIIKTAHEFLAGLGFIYYALAPKKNQLDAKTIGDTGFNKQIQEATIFIPGNSPAMMEQYQKLINVPLIVLVKDSNCAADLYMHMGCDCEGAFLAGDFATGTSDTGVKGITAKITYDGPVQYYTVSGGPAIIAD